MPQVSVVINFLNAQRYLRESIDSVIGQTFRDWELLLVDDGSTDESATIAQSYVDQFPGQVRYLTHPGRINRGAAAARNLGIAESRGEFVAFLDADDIWMPDKLADQVGRMRSHPEVAMVYGPGYFFEDGSGETSELGFLQPLGLAGDEVIQSPRLFLTFLANFNISPSPSGILVRREAAQGVTGFVEDFKGIHQVFDDQVFYAKLTLRHAVFADRRCWYRYRLHADSCGAETSRRQSQYLTQRMYAYWLSDYVATLPALDTAVARAVERFVWTTVMDEIAARPSATGDASAPLWNRVRLCREMTTFEHNGRGILRAGMWFSLAARVLFPQTILKAGRVVKRDGLGGAWRTAARRLAMAR